MTPPTTGGRAAAIDPPLERAARATPGFDRLLRRLDHASDRLSPIVVKEVRQIVRGREFTYSFFASLATGLVVAFLGASTAGPATRSGQWVFGALTACLALIGFVVAPFGAFTALRTERLEQTMDLVTVSALSPRRIVVGKLLAQAVKLATLFAGMAPFVAMSFLLGGIDFVTILVSLALVFLGSIYLCAGGLFLSSIPTGRAMSGLLVAGIGVFVLLLIGAGRIVYVLARSVAITSVTASGGAIVVAGAPAVVAGAPAAGNWWLLGALATLSLANLANLVLLAENRLSSPVEDKASALRVGFFIQFLLIAGLFTAIEYFVPAVPSVVDPIAALCGLQLALVATFVVTEDLQVSRRVLVTMSASRWRWLNAVLRPGGGRGALYVLAQMVILLVVLWFVEADASDLRGVAALCGYICFFTGAPVIALRALKPDIPSFLLRIAILVLVSASLVVPDVLYYVLWRPEVIDLGYAFRHLVNPVRTVANWAIVEREGWMAIPLMLGTTGVLIYIAIAGVNIGATRRQMRAHLSGGAGAS